VRMGNVLYITSPANAKELRTEPDLAPSTLPGPPVQILPGQVGVDDLGGMLPVPPKP